MPNQSVRFDTGGEEYIATLSPALGTAFTVLGWWRLAVDRNAWSTLFGIDNAAGAGSRYALQCNATGVELRSVAEDNNQAVATLTVGTWYAAAHVRASATAATIYLGTSAASLATTAHAIPAGQNSYSTFRIGESGWGGEWLNGNCAFVKVYTRALSAAEVQAELAAYTPGPTANLYAAYRFWDGPSTADVSGNGHTLTGGGGTTTEAGPSGVPLAIHIKTGGAAARGAGAGVQSVLPAGAVHAKTGGAAASGAGAGTRVVNASYPKAGGAAAAGAGAGVKVRNATNPKVGGAAAKAAGGGVKVHEEAPVPADVLDLSYWHLTTPADSGDGDAEQIDQPALDSYTSEFFYVDAQGLVVCYAPVDGFTTSGASGATRAELRQRRKGTYALAGWNPTVNADRWQMTITIYVDASGVSGGTTPRDEAICAQIHGAGDSPIPLIMAAEYHVSPARIRIYKNGPGFANPVTNIDPDTPITIRIRVENDRLKVWAIAGLHTDLPDPVTTTAPYDWPISDFTDQAGWYFKAGIYNKTQISSGSSGATQARIAYLNVLEPSDAEEQTSTTYDKAGGAAAAGAGAGTKTVTPPTVHSKAGGAAARGAGSGTKTVTPATIHAKAGGAAGSAAGAGTRTVTSATVHAKGGGAAGQMAGAGARQFVRSRDGGGAAAGAGSGARSRAAQRGGGAASVAAGSAGRALAHGRTGGAAAAGAGTGDRDVLHTRTGGAATAGAGAGARSVASPAVHQRAGGAAVFAAGAGTADVVETGVDYLATGGAAARVGGGGASALQHPTVHTRTGGAAAAAAATGTAERVSAAVHARGGGAAVRGAGSGVASVLHPAVHPVSGGAAARGGGSGVQDVDPAEAISKTGGAAAVAAGIALVEVIPPATHIKTGGAAPVVAGSGRRRVGGRMHAGVPVAVGQLAAGRATRR